MELPVPVAISSLIDRLRPAETRDPSPGASPAETAFNPSPERTPDSRAGARPRQAANTAAGVMGRAGEGRRRGSAEGLPLAERRADHRLDATRGGQSRRCGEYG